MYLHDSNQSQDSMLGRKQKSRPDGRLFCFLPTEVYSSESSTSSDSGLIGTTPGIHHFSQLSSILSWNNLISSGAK